MAHYPRTTFCSFLLSMTDFGGFLLLYMYLLLFKTLSLVTFINETLGVGFFSLVNSTTTSEMFRVTFLSLLVEFFFFFSLVEILLRVGESIEGFLLFEDIPFDAKVY